MDLGWELVEGGWRNSFDLRVEPIAGSSYTVAALSTPDGFLQYFRPDGSAILSTDTVRYRLVSYAQGYRLTSPEGMLTFNLQGKLTSWQHVGGTTLTFQYSNGMVAPDGQDAILEGDLPPTKVAVPSGLLIGITSTSGRTLRIDRDPAGRILKIAGGGINIQYFHYGSQLVRVQRSDGSTRKYFYNEPGFVSSPAIQLLTGISEAGVDGVETRYATFTYDGQGRGISTEHAGGVEKYSLSYGGDGTATVTDPANQTRTMSFVAVNGVLQFASQTQPAGAGCNASASQQTYDAYGNVSSRNDFNQTRSCYVADGVRHLEAVRVEGLPAAQACAGVTVANASLPAGSVKFSTTWHPDWPLPIKQASPGRIETTIYNGQPDPFNGNAVASCAPASAVMADGKPIVVVCKNVQQATTDADGHLGFSAALQTGVTARVISWTYNADGQVLTAKGSRSDINDTTSYAYYTDTTTDHTRGDLKTVTNPQGKVTTVTKYDLAGNALQSADPNGVVTVNTFDGMRRLKTTTVGGEAYKLDYDGVGQVKKVTLPNLTWIGFDYDAAHRQVAVYDNKGNTIKYTVDNSGNRTSEDVKDPGNSLRRSLARIPDALSRLQQLTGRE